MTELNSLTIKQAKEGLIKREFSSFDLTEACLAQIEKVDKKINAFIKPIAPTYDDVVSAARKADKLLSSNQDLPLLGIPIAVKDNFSTMGIRTTASSKVLDDYIPPYDATVVKKLKDAGAVLIGKTNMDAWAHGSSTETSDYGSTKNPWNTKHLPGGSSGGSAAAVAADEAIAAIGSETAGSIRQPASWCGVVGLKPTYGRVSRYGVIAMASSLDSPGPITKTVEDSALLLRVLAGTDEFDATTSLPPVGDYTLPVVDNKIKNLKIGISDEYFIDGIDKEVESAVRLSIEKLEKMGAKIVKINLVKPKYATSVYTIIQRSEVSSNLARYDGVRFGKDRKLFGEEAKRRIVLGTYSLSSGYYNQYYNRAAKARSLIVNDFEKAFEKVNVILGPTSPSLPLHAGASENAAMFGEIADILVEPSSIAGLPGINIPIGFSKSMLPIGMQIIGRQFAEDLVLQVAHQYEMATANENWRKKRPNL
ncbi:MAG: glutaminyl-tRNA synthase (glutamine-hydrolyzing) subunit A [Candidatus Levybacteria bacterium RIFCSPHIGHO2_01_FULL_37_17]|nr:MAG: glutaminyl-tRNA synthase (glutamine-hydrolyzing) subunit A [Candidatus Levybacteria bacterium RIFCSPHIGHO2_01_FULL_37_17]OGH36918.1 MAG: glutaminyl-tRNA synthase (glutamine-hydrolyzing) subunit A [Candidatus Levybacteria bacterium RIFCSPLOWO2_01_FULL_38_23]